MDKSKNMVYDMSKCGVDGDSMQKRICKRAPENSRCFYCFANATGFDHIIPYSICRENTDMVPCCAECNRLLGNTLFDDVWEKKSYIAHTLPKKFASTLKMKVFCLEGLEGKLRKTIEAELDFKDFVISRIEFAQNNPIDKPETFDRNEAEKPFKNYLLQKENYI